MSIVVAILLGLLALAFVLYPLYRPAITRKGRPPGASKDMDDGRHAWGLYKPVSEQEQQGLQDEREQAARTALQEVELDFQLGNISETDYGLLRERYMRRALVALKSRYDREQELDTLIEVQLQKMREQDNDAKN